MSSNYYFIADGTIVESGYYNPSELVDIEETAQELANDHDCHVYVIRGEHAGIEASPQDPRDAMMIDEIDQATEDAQAYVADLDKLARWNAMVQR